MPADSTVERTSSTVVGLCSPAVIRLPPSKSIPRLSCLVANESAPTSRMQPERLKKYLLARLKSKCQRTRCSGRAPSAAGERMKRARPNRPRKACVKTTAVNREAIVPTPSVKAKPFTFAVARANKMNAVIRVITFASMIVAMPRR
jgi:hypothetical protein